MTSLLLPLLLCLSLVSGLWSLPSAAAARRPNIIFLLTDDQRDNTFGGMGHPFVKTPNVDRLLKQSVRFRNTYIAEPVCAPSRVSFLTGMHERVHGVGFTSSYQLTVPGRNPHRPLMLSAFGCGHHQWPCATRAKDWQC